MIFDVCFSALITLSSFGFGLYHTNETASIFLGSASAVSWAVGSTTQAPVRFNSNLNIIAAAFAAAAVGFSAPHA